MVKVNGWKEMPEGILGVSTEEAETVINASRGEAEASVCTTDAVWYRRMLSLCKRDPACRAVGYEICGGQPQVGHFMVPKGFVKVQPKPARRPLSEEQRAARAFSRRSAFSRRYSSVRTLDALTFTAPFGTMKYPTWGCPPQIS